MSIISQLLNHHDTITKIYIGYLPVSIDDVTLREAFGKYCNVVDVIIKKGNAQGQFDKFCYGFVSIACDQIQSNDIISKVLLQFPNWKMKIKQDNSQVQTNKFTKPPSNQYQNYQNVYPQPITPVQRPNYPNYNQNYVSNQNQNDKGQIYGEKTSRIMVRQLWLGGIPEMMDHQTMSRIMSEFGIVQGTQIFPKFAFVKFKRAIDATNAYERAQRIHQLFGHNIGFRISFSDPSRRKDIVANHYEFQRTAVYLPILFLGFPPITSANIQMNHMRTICQKYGTIQQHFLKKSTNPQMRSYFLFTYQNVKTAQKAKNQLYRRKDLLGEKRVQMTLVLDQESVLQGRQLSYIDKKHGPEAGMNNDKMKKPTYQSYIPQQSQSQQSQQYGGNYPMNPYPGMGMNPNPMGNYGMSYPGMYPPQHPQISYQQQQNMYYNPGYQNQKSQKQDEDMLSIIQSVLDDKSKQKVKVPLKSQQDTENAVDIISKMLGKDVNGQKKESQQVDDNDQNKERQPGWSGFILWKGQKRAGVDGYLQDDKEAEFTEYSISINSTISSDDLLLKEKNNVMTLQPSNSITQPAFKEYLKMLKTRVGVSATKNWVIFVMGSEIAKEKVRQIKDNELLVVMEKSNIIPFIKDKIAPCEDFASD